ncbi:MAG: hypothetical protein GY849_22275 [Deltaproteobacteria bacterium]|nr:hypothetical protein [Deltaproteobacteria bacterium]
MKKWIILCVIFSLASFSACSYWNSRTYYAAHPTPAEDVEFQWGKPLRVETLENGTVKWIYLISDGFLHDEVFFVIQDGRVVDSGVN